VRENNAVAFLATGGALKTKKPASLGDERPVFNDPAS